VTNYEKFDSSVAAICYLVDSRSICTTWNHCE